MTLIIGGINNENAFLSSDRRISSNGSLIDDETTKTFFITTPDSRGVFAFTGLAYFKGFNTQNWLQNWLLEIVKTETEIEKIFRCICSQLDIDFNSKKIGYHNPLLTILYVGYKYSNSNVEPRIFRISNFEFGGKADSFVFTEHDTAKIQLAGQVDSVDDSQKDKLSNLLIENKLEALKIVSYLSIDKASKSPLSNNAVGQKANVCAFSALKDSPMQSIYFCNSLNSKCYGANCFLYNGNSFMAMLGSELTVPSFGDSTVIPKTNRNYPCPCGSGLKYKKCHESIRYPYLPMAARVEFNDDGFNSGKIFYVENIGAY